MVVPTMDTYQQADFVLSKVQSLYDSGVQYDQIAILYEPIFMQWSYRLNSLEEVFLFLLPVA